MDLLLKVAHTVQVYNSVQLYSLGAVQVYNSADCGVPDRSDLGTLRSRAVCKRSTTVRCVSGASSDCEVPTYPWCCYRRLCAGRASSRACIDGFFSFNGSVGLEEAVDEPCVEQRQPPRLAHHSVPVWPPFQARGVAGSTEI